MRKPAEVFCLGEFLADEMQARGWTSYDVAKRMPGDYRKNLLIVAFTLSLQDENLLLSKDVAALLAGAFEVSPDYIENLHRAWLENPEGRQPFECPENLLPEIVMPANDAGPVTSQGYPVAGGKDG